MRTLNALHVSRHRRSRTGTGKSTIAYEISKRLKTDGILGATFFFLRGDQELSSTRLVFSTIAYQLSQNQPSLAPYIAAAARKYPVRGTTQTAEVERDHFILEPLRAAGNDHKPVVVVIDAVDECLQDMLDLVPRMMYLLMGAAVDSPFPFVDLYSCVQHS